MPSIHDLESIEQVRSHLRLEPYYLKRLRTRFYKKSASPGDALQELPPSQREAFTREVAFRTLTLEERHDSRLDGASKLIFRTTDNSLIEAVILRIKTGRTSLCISSQVGCAASCAFCATGQMGLHRNLSVAEILDQLIQANLLLKEEDRQIRNLVFMGMGEPFHNEANLHAALAVLSSPQCFNFSEKRLLVSTVGIPDAMRRCARRFPGVNLALSLHSARQEVRQSFMPIAKRHPLPELQDALREITARQQQPVMIEYLMLKGLNDTPEDLAALTDYLAGIPVHINLITYNPTDCAREIVGTAQPEREAFGAALRAVGFTVTLRYSLGADIAAACGQLVQQKREKTG
jgi:23S rRNA (adenine2503-C2)-methyltransferase